MRPWKPVIWALVAAVLFGIWYVDRTRVLTRDRTALEAGRLVPFDFLDARRIEIRNREGTITLERRDDQSWWIVEPMQTEADADQVRVLVDNFHGAKKSGTFRTTDYGGYGLDSPTATVRMQGVVNGSPRDVTVFLADSSNRAGFVYGAVQGVDEVFTVGDWVRNQAMITANDLRNRRLLRIATDSIRRLSVENPTSSFLVERDAADPEGWRLRPTDQPGHRFLIDRALSVLSLANVMTILDEENTPPAEETGLHEPVVTLVFEDADDGREMIEVGAKLPGDDRFYVRATNLAGVGIVRASVVADWFQAIEAFGTRRVVWMPEPDWIFVETRSLGSRMQLDRDEDGAWRFVGMPDLGLHPRRLELFLESLGSFSAINFMARNLPPEEETSRFGIRPETYVVSVISEDGREEGFRMGSLVAGEGYAYMKRLQDNTIWTVDASAVHHVTAFRADLQDKRILGGFERPVARVRLTLAEEGTTFDLTRRNNVWRLRLPGGTTAILPTTRVDEFLGAVEDLEWDSIAVLTTDPEVEFTMEFFDDDGEAMLALSELKPANDRTLLRTPEGVFEVTPISWRMMIERWMVLLESAEAEPRQ